MLARFDLPVVWLALALGSVLAVGDFLGRGYGGAAARGAGLVVAVAGIATILWAVAVMRAARTAVMPGRAPARLVTTGPFGLSRNPIYLGMAGIVAGLALWTGSIPGLLVVPVFAAVISKRFILDEEARLTAAFGADFAAWSAGVPRWIGVPGRSGGNSSDGSSQALK